MLSLYRIKVCRIKVPSTSRLQGTCSAPQRLAWHFTVERFPGINWLTELLFLFIYFIFIYLNSIMHHGNRCYFGQFLYVRFVNKIDTCSNFVCWTCEKADGLHLRTSRSLQGLQSERASKQTWELAGFSTFTCVYIVMSYIKMFSDSPGIQSCKKYIQIILFYFSAVPKSVPVAAQQMKMAAIDSLKFGSTD